MRNPWHDWEWHWARQSTKVCFKKMWEHVEKGGEGRRLKAKRLLFISIFQAHHQTWTKNNRSGNDISRLVERGCKQAEESLGLDKGLGVGGQGEELKQEQGRWGIWFGLPVGIINLSQSSSKAWYGKPRDHSKARRLGYLDGEIVTTAEPRVKSTANNRMLHVIGVFDELPGET